MWCMMKEYKKVIQFGIVSFMLLNIFTNVIKIFPSSLYYRLLLIIEILLIVIACFVMGFRVSISKNCRYILILILFSQILAYIVDYFFEDYNCFDIHRLFAFIGMYLVIFEWSKKTHIDLNYLNKLNCIIVLLAIAASIYNLIIHRDTIFPFNLNHIMYYTSTYASFFLTRSNYALILTVAFSISIYNYEETKKFSWLISSVYMLMNILLTNARTSIITVAIVLLIFLFLQKKSVVRNLLIVMCISFALVILPWNSIISKFFMLTSKYSLLFRTDKGDLSNGRFELWTMAFSDVNIFSFIFGHGIGAKDAYLESVSAFAKSFHSSWVDLFYEGGIILYMIYIHIFYTVINRVKKSFLSITKKRLFYSYFIILILCGFGDAVALPLMLDTSTIIASIMFISVPLNAVNGALLKQKEISNEGYRD